MICGNCRKNFTHLRIDGVLLKKLSAPGKLMGVAEKKQKGDKPCQPFQ